MNRIAATLLPLALLALPALAAQTGGTAQVTQPPAKQRGSFSAEQLEQLVAPIALYPDALLAQVLMAATYPLEIVQAARWVQQNPTLKASVLANALQSQTWDPSVKSMCGVPDVLKRMNDNLNWTQDLGDAFLNDQAKVMDAVQTMRRKASEAGDLKTSQQQTVTETSDSMFEITPADPEVLYVPTYYPVACYGGWAYAHWYYPALYHPCPIGTPRYGYCPPALWGSALWGGCHWGAGAGNVYINHNEYKNFVNHTENYDRRAAVAAQMPADGQWQHAADHRMAVPYANNNVAQRYGATSYDRSAVSRDQAYGRASSYDTPRANAVAEQRPAANAYNNGYGYGRSTTGLNSGGNYGASSAGFDQAASQRGSYSRGSYGARGFSGGFGRGRR
jgi:hypothetical protein